MSADLEVEEGQPVATDSDRFWSLLGGFRASLEVELERFLERKRRQCTSEVADALELTGKLDPYVLRGGKRLRPALLYYSYRACGGERRDSVLPAALAMELLHTYLLIHDDIMDHSETRRGGPTAHRVFREEHRERGWRGSSEHHGESVAILLGDLAYSFAVELFHSCPLDESVRAGVQACFSTMCQEVIVGQYLEMTAAYRRDLDEEDLLRVLRMKSGRYSVERPIQIGALMAGAGSELLDGLSRFGLLTGEAFQLQDDLLGMFGDTERMGKPVDSDLAEGKYTVLIQQTLRRASPVDAETVTAALGNPEIGLAEVERVQAIIRGSGARDRVVSMVEGRIEEAAAILDGLDLTAEGREFFRGLARYLRERER
jgi:geranylgeranyl diphosphate synthase type I